jgi:4'-phosphopantetheinyl transferase
MAGLGWLTRELAEVPPHDRWLSEREREVLSGLRIAKRRADWRLGRWTAKAAVAAWRRVPEETVEVAAAADGAPEALIDGEDAAVSLSISHRAGRGLAAVSESPGTVGCDLEVIEPRSPAFLREWLRPTERELVRAQSGWRRDFTANLIWSAKEAATKARRGGLRLNVRQATVEVDGLPRSPGAWLPLRVVWKEGTIDLGWWREEPELVMAVVSDPPFEALPRQLR